jgi:hypothetical protein
MARYDHLPIWKQAVELTRRLEESVRRFPRYHKYALGSDLRRQAYRVCRLIVAANAAQERREQVLDRLAAEVDALKLLIQMGKEVRAFTNFNDFQGAAEGAVALGKQCGGWRRSLAPVARRGAGQRPEGASRGTPP